MNRKRQIVRCALATVACFLAVSCACHAGSSIYKNNVLTARHVPVSGTHVTLIPPSGATPAESFLGFEIASARASLRITEKLGVSYAKSAKDLTPQALEADGVKIVDSSRVTLNGRPATLFEGTIGQGESVGLFLLVAGNENFTTQIYGFFPMGDRKTKETLKESMLSVILRPSQSENGRGFYRLSTAGTAFKFAGEANMTRYYTPDGTPPSDTLETALYTVTVMTETSVPEDERDSFARQTMDKYLAEHPYTISGTRKITHAGLPGIELLADFSGISRRTRTASGARVARTMPGKGFLTILFDNSSGRVYSINGLAAQSSEKYLAQFRSMTASFALVE